ncbi:MAG: DUF983 domain-containing protein [Planktomarina sp.]
MNTQTPQYRPIWPALGKALRCKCPNCGKGNALHSYLKVQDKCPECGEELHHARADDGPAYLTVFAVGKILVPLIYVLYVKFTMDPLAMAILLSVMALVLSLIFLPIMKCIIIAFQWSRRMGGFGEDG